MACCETQQIRTTGVYDGVSKGARHRSVRDYTPRPTNTDRKWSFLLPTVSLNLTRNLLLLDCVQRTLEALAKVFWIFQSYADSNQVKGNIERGSPINFSIVS